MTKLKFGTTNIVIEKGMLNGCLVENMSIDLNGLYLIKCSDYEQPFKITVSPETASLNRDNISQLFTVVSKSPVVFSYDDIVAIETEQEQFANGVYIYNIRVINTMIRTGVAVITITAQNGDTTDLKVQVDRGY